jgi:hypothetical protein
MANKKDSEKRETDAAFAVATTLLNVLILLTIVGVIWMLQSITAYSSALHVLIGDSGFRF